MTDKQKALDAIEDEINLLLVREGRKDLQENFEGVHLWTQGFDAYLEGTMVKSGWSSCWHSFHLIGFTPEASDEEDGETWEQNLLWLLDEYRGDVYQQIDQIIETLDAYRQS